MRRFGTTSVSDAESHVRRPLLPPTLWAMLATLAAQRAMLRGGRPWLSGPTGIVLVVVACACVSAVFASVVLRWRIRPYGLLLVAVVLVVSLCETSMLLERSTQSNQVLAHTPISSLDLYVDTDPIPSERGLRCTATVLVDGRRLCRTWVTTSDELRCGQTIRCVGRFTPNREDDWGVAARMRGLLGMIDVVRVSGVREPEGFGAVLHAVRGIALTRIDPGRSDERALVAGCVCGWRRSLKERGLSEHFSRAGASHLIAVSGSHIGFVTALVGMALAHTRMRQVPRLLLLALASGGFVIFCGAPSSAVRAWVMAVLGFGSSMMGRRAHGLSRACLAALCMALADPYACGDLGFMLSVSSVCALCVFAPYVSHVLRLVPHPSLGLRWVPRSLMRRLRRFGDAVLDSLAASLVCSLATMPISSTAFGTISLVGPITNVLVFMPFSAFMASSMTAVLLAGVPTVSVLAWKVSDALAHMMLAIVEAMARVPHGCISVPEQSLWCVVVPPFVGTALLLAWPHVTRRHMRAVLLSVATACALVVVRLGLGSGPRIVVLDVGQGDAILIQDGAHAMLVDTGPDRAIAEALVRHGVLHLDAVVLTHLHDDHYGGVEELAGGFSCDRIIVARGVTPNMPVELREAADELCGGNVEEVGYGDMMRMGDFVMHVISPVGPVSGLENPDSLELLVLYDQGGRHLVGLLTGDAERDETGAALRRGDLGDIDFLKVGHHGSAASLTAQLATELDPEVSVASAGEGNRYGHPNRDCVEVLAGAGSTFYCTKDVGDVEVRPGPQGPEVGTQRQAPP